MIVFYSTKVDYENTKYDFNQTNLIKQIKIINLNLFETFMSLLKKKNINLISEHNYLCLTKIIRTNANNKGKQIPIYYVYKRNVSCKKDFLNELKLFLCFSLDDSFFKNIEFLSVEESNSFLILVETYNYIISEYNGLVNNFSKLFTENDHNVENLAKNNNFPNKNKFDKIVRKYHKNNITNFCSYSELFEIILKIVIQTARHRVYYSR